MGSDGITWLWFGNGVLVIYCFWTWTADGALYVTDVGVTGLDTGPFWIGLGGAESKIFR